MREHQSPAKKRILFLLKHRDYRYACDPPYSYGALCSGLLNSAKLVADMLRDQLGYIVDLVQVRDNNQIDREVTRFRPDICVIEAYWVVPEKFAVLHKRHPHVIWVVRNHSSMPFLSLEGVVIDWSLRYLAFPNVVLACNDARTDAEFRFLLALTYPHMSEEELARRCVLLPNYYPAKLHLRRPHDYGFAIHVSCFGAIRPLKNQLIQAVAALEFAEMIDRPIRFHINATRIEQMAHPILKNLRALFEHTDHGHQLVEHPWMNRKEFLALVAKMDIGLHVSFSETFSIGAADLVTRGVPVVTSPEIPWVHPSYYADPNLSDDIARKMVRAIRSRCATKRNLRGLKRFVSDSKLRWSRFIEGNPILNS